MKKLYIKPFIKTISVTARQVLCSSGYEIEVNSKVKKYGCPIKQGLDCSYYDKVMNEYELAIEHLAETKQDFTFYQGSDEDHCPYKTSCLIYLEWQKQQKTR